MKENKCKRTGKIKAIYLYNNDDIIIDKNGFRLKRKYGKFTRPVVRFPLTDI